MFLISRLRCMRACLALLGALYALSGAAEGQGVLGFTGQIRSALPQSTVVEPVAAVSRTCSSISSKSRRCHFTFALDCKKRGETREHCTRMSGFCHACTDAYATCKGDANVVKEKTKAQSTDCASCNVAYSRCIQRMVEQYGGKRRKPD